MKVALILTGLTRAWELSYPSFKRLVLDRYETATFIDIWSEIGYYSGKNYLPDSPEGFCHVVEGDRGYHTSGEIVDIRPMIEAYKPIAIRTEDFSRFEDRLAERAKQFTNAFTRPKNTVSQAYKAAQGVKFFQEYYQLADFDLMIRARPDISMDFDGYYWNPYHFYTLPSRNKKNMGTGDSIQVGSPQNIAKFSYAQWGNLERYYQEIGYSCPHMFAQQTILDTGMKDIWIEMPPYAHVTHSKTGIPYQEPV